MSIILLYLPNTLTIFPSHEALLGSSDSLLSHFQNDKCCSTHRSRPEQHLQITYKRQLQRLYLPSRSTVSEKLNTIRLCCLLLLDGIKRGAPFVEKLFHDRALPQAAQPASLTNNLLSLYFHLNPDCHSNYAF